MASTNSKLLYDLTYLSDASQDDPQFIKKLVGMFIDLIPGSMAELNESMKSGDMIQLRKTAHKMKSSIDLLGIISLSDPLKRLENIGDNDPSLENQVAYLNSGISEVLAQLTELI